MTSVRSGPHPGADPHPPRLARHPLPRAGEGDRAHLVPPLPPRRRGTGEPASRGEGQRVDVPIISTSIDASVRSWAALRARLLPAGGRGRCYNPAMLAAAKVLWWALVGLYDETFLL